MSSENPKIELNFRYKDGLIDDDLPWVGELKTDPETGRVYDEEGDVLDTESFLALCGDNDGRGPDEDGE